MIASKTEMFNQILLRLGEKRVSSWEGTEDRVVVLRGFFNHAVDEVLKEYLWICATSRAVLAQLPDTNLTQYDYVYQLPSDCITVQSLIDVYGETYADVEDVYLIEGRRLYTDLESAGIKYTTNNVEVTELDTYVAEAIVLKVAAKSAFTITKDITLEADMYVQYKEALNIAKSADGIERINRTVSQELWTD